MEFHFHIEEIDDGWMDVSVSDGERRVLISNSDYMGNDAPRLLLNVLTRLAKKQEGTAYLCWNDEPGGYHWTLEKKSDRLSYQIGVMENPDKDYRTFEGSGLKDSALADILLKGEVGFREFAEEILREITDFSEGEKLDIYESEWSGFPTEEISALRRSLDYGGVKMDSKKSITMYLLGSIGQIFIIGALVFILRKGGVQVDYTNALGMIFIALGGISSTLWGVIVSVKNGTRFKKIIRDFFDVKKSYRYYPLILIFLLIDFCGVFFGGAFSVMAWYTPILLFAKAIIFGVIEEIGWRYTFQPIVEKKTGFIPATLITFIAWGVWHFLYFYIEGTIAQINILPFLAGLLTNCFMLAIIFRKTQSLWLCVMTHALVNTFSQIAVGGNEYVAAAGKAVIIITSVYMAFREDKKD